jgi:hypothetical protein
MAKPIRATPTLTGADAINFLNRMKKTENSAPTQADKKMINLIKENEKYFSKLFFN